MSDCVAIICVFIFICSSLQQGRHLQCHGEQGGVVACHGTLIIFFLFLLPLPPLHHSLAALHLSSSSSSSLSGRLCIGECSGRGPGEREGASDGDSLRRDSTSRSCGGHGKHQRTLQQAQNVDACSGVRSDGSGCVRGGGWRWGAHVEGEEGAGMR